jgi:hypothetical protein
MNPEDCVWYADEGGQKMKALCLECHGREFSKDFGWFWEGSRRGYGAYDLDCSLCGRPLNRKEENEDDQTQTGV